MRDRAAMIDLTAFAIFDVTGPGALDVVQRLAMRQMDVAVGRVVYTPLLTPSGGFKQDLTIMRLADDVFRVVTGGAYGMSDLKWFADHLPDGRLGADPRSDERLVHARAVGAARARHPRERHQRRRLARGLPVRPLQDDRDRPARRCWPRGSPTSATSAGSCTSRSSRARGCGTSIAEAGAPHGIIPAGIGVYGTTGRLEKCYRAYGAELEGDFNVVEAGMAWGKVKDQDFIGKEAHVAPPRGGAGRDHVHADRRRPHLGSRRQALHARREPILTRDGEPLTDRKGRRSYVTSAGAGPSIGKYILMSYLPPEHAVVGEQLAVEYMGERYPVTVAAQRLDPDLRPRELARSATMNILVCVKRVPLTGGKIVLTDDERAISTAHLGFTVSPHEECGAEEAVRLVEQHGGSLDGARRSGPPEAEEQLRDMMAIGVDRAIHLVTDGGEWDPQATARAIVEAIQRRAGATT